MKKNYSSFILISVSALFACNPQQKDIEPTTSCRISKIIQKNMKPDFPFPENIEYGGKVYKIGINTTTQFEYDNQGRINQYTLEFSLPPSTSNRKSTYEYSSSEIKETRYYPDGIQYQFSYKLNNQGNIIAGNENIYQYDSNGFLAHHAKQKVIRSNIIENGNIIQSYQYDTSNGMTGEVEIKYEYDLTKPGFLECSPSGLITIDFGDYNQALATFLGKPSQNLVIKSTQKTSYIFSDGQNFKSTRTETYNYQYNKAGQIIRMITNSEIISPEAPQNLLHDISVLDFEYECQ